MRVLSSTWDAARHALGSTVQAALIVGIAVTLVFGAAVVSRHDPAGAASVFAARGGNGGGGGGGHAGVSGQSSIALNEDPWSLRLGSPVTFTTTIEDLKGGEYPMVYVACFAPGTGQILYGQLDHPNVTFVLGGGSSPWWLVGGPANCLAHLYSYGGKTQGGYDEIRELAPAYPFDVAG